MYKNVLRSIDDVSLFPVISILIFFIFFTILLIVVWRMDKKKIKQFTALPLSDSFSESTSESVPQTN